MADDISKFLNKYKDSKKSDLTEDKSQNLKDRFKELWEAHIRQNPFNHQTKLYLINGNKFDSHELLWKFMCDRFPRINDAKLQVNEEFKDDYKGSIPSHLLELFTFLQEISNQDNEMYKKKEEVKKLNSQLDILPTFLNLMGISYNDKWYTGSDILDSKYKGMIVFPDLSWYDGTYYVVDNVVTNKKKISANLLEEKNSYAEYLIKKNDLVLKYNYFKEIMN